MSRNRGKSAGFAPYLSSGAIAAFMLGGATLTAGTLCGAIAQDAAFERALAAQPPRRAPAADPLVAPAPANRGQKPKPAPAPLPRWRGVGIPPELRAMRAMSSATSPEGALISRAFREGRLDLAALYEQIEGPLPLPPGAKLLDCPASANAVYYSLGLPLTPAYLAGVQAVEEEARRPVDPEDAADPYPMKRSFELEKEVWAQQDTAARRAMKAIDSHFTAAGFKLADKGNPEWVRPSRGGGPMQLRMYVEMQSHDADQACRKLGYPAPNGPTVRVWYL